jgi:urea transporter
VPLSEDEQRILSEIEQQLYESDPSLRTASPTTVYSDAYRHLKRGIFGFVVGVVVMLGTLHLSEVPYLPALGVLIMFGCALSIEANARRMGKAGLDQITQSMKTAGIRDYLGQPGGRMRDRFRKDEQ